MAYYLCNSTNNNLIKLPIFGFGSNKLYVNESIYSPWKQIINFDCGTDNILGIAYGKNVFVILTENNGLYYTKDFTSYTKATISSSSNLRSITYGNGKFLVIGYYSTGYYSTDGITWVLCSIPFMTSLTTESIAYGAGKFVCVSNNKAYYTTNLTSWTNMTGTPTDGSNENRISYGINRFICGFGSKRYYSIGNSGTAWTATTESNMNHAVYGRGLFISSNGRKGISYSNVNDVTTWTTLDNLFTNTVVYFAYNNDRWFGASPVDSSRYYSIDGTTWVADSNSRTPFNPIIGLASTFVEG